MNADERWIAVGSALIGVDRRLKHIREGEVPVEETVLRREPLDLVAHPRCQVMGAAFDLAEDPLRGRAAQGRRQSTLEWKMSRLPWQKGQRIRFAFRHLPHDRFPAPPQAVQFIVASPWQ